MELQLLVGIVIGLAVGLVCGLEVRRHQIQVARWERHWAGWRAVCAQAAANRLGWPERLP
jgi:hypothetical protein